MRSLLIGSLLTLCPMLFLGMVLIKRNLPVFGFYFALTLIGYGYLLATGAVEDIGTWALVFVSHPLKD